MTSGIPPRLRSYLALPPRGSLVLLTGVLAATTNWLILLYLYAALGGAPSRSVAASAECDPEREDVAVVLVSWMRDWEFWRLEARRSVGLDLARLQQDGRLTFIDGLTSLFNPRSGSNASPGPRGSPPPAQPPHLPPHHETPGSKTTPSHPSPDLITQTILSAITTHHTSSPGSKILLILDTPHVLLATAPPADPTAPSEALTSQSLYTSLLRLRQHVHAAIVTGPADAPLLRAASLSLAAGTASTTPLETATAALTVSLAHQARFVLGVRTLETGWAGDVSGVLRAARGAGGGGEDGDAAEVEEGEWLYHVRGDGGGVRVWARGEAEA